MIGCMHAGVLEQALGLLVSLLLRNPAAAERAAAEGCVDTVLEAMEAAEAKRGFADSPVGAQWVLRQVCRIFCLNSIQASAEKNGHRAC